LTASDDEVTILHTSVLSSTVPDPTPVALELPGLPPAAIEALQSPPAGMYAYNMPVYQSASPLAMPQLLQRYLNFEATDYFNPPMQWNTSVGLAWNAPSYVSELSISPHTPPPSTPDAEDDTLLLIQPFETTFPAPPTPVSDEPLVLSLQDARSVDLLAITNGFEGRPIKKEYSTDTSCTLGTHDSARSGDWCEYQKGKKMGMDLADPFIDDSEMDQIFRDFKPL
jgi:hypothetical protein